MAQDCIGKCSFWHQRKLCHAPLAIDQGGGVLIAAKSCALYRDIVRDDEVKAFRSQLVSSMGDHIVRLSSETDYELCGSLGR